ncbi:beta-galactosidase [Lacticaseibacillus rhamnosus]|uniref:Beta-galactosidase n=1 Tax=Lacticaseibacillus rhamnosus TaxID=47715 RepID=A0AAX0K1P3_LACRH|nr:beta-galactosidase [Lacticaseibacillus rhamnosus]
MTITRSPAQKSACKDLKRNGQDRAITLKAAYTPTSKRAGSRSQKKSRFQTTPSSLRTTIQAVK